MPQELLNEAAYNELTQNTNCIVQFTADWCGPCKQLKPVLEEVSQNLGVDYRTVNIDSNRDFAMSKGIRSVPFIEVYSGGTLKESFVGSKNKSQIEEILAVYFG